MTLKLRPARPRRRSPGGVFLICVNINFHRSGGVRGLWRYPLAGVSPIIQLQLFPSSNPAPRRKKTWQIEVSDNQSISEAAASIGEKIFEWKIDSSAAGGMITGINLTNNSKQDFHDQPKGGWYTFRRETGSQLPSLYKGKPRESAGRKAAGLSPPRG